MTGDKGAGPGRRVTMNKGRLMVPDDPIIPYIEGDGIGPDIWAAASRVLQAAVARAYGGERRIIWREVLAGEKAYGQTGCWLPEETLAQIREMIIAIKGPLTTPVGEGIRSLNVALRQELDLYACLRPVRYFPGVPSPVKYPERVNMVIFRENTEDIYAGIEFEEGSAENRKLLRFLKEELKVTTIRFPDSTALGVKPISRQGTRRLVRAAVEYALARGRRSVTFVHKGNIMKFTEGAFNNWAYELVEQEYGKHTFNARQYARIKAEKGEKRAGQAQEEAAAEGKVMVRDLLADIFLQQVLIHPGEYDVVATMNLNGDYISDALAAQVGGIGIAPGANINFETGHAVFEATHGTAPKYAGLDRVNPSSVLLSGEMMLRHLGWSEAADLIIGAMERSIADRRVTHDFAFMIEDSVTLKTSQFADELIANL